MMLIRVTYENVCGQLLAQNLQTYECICQVEQAQECDHEVVDNIPTGFMQLLYPGTFGKYLDIATIQQIETLREGLTDEEFARIGTIPELVLTKKIEELIDDIDWMALMFLKKEGVL